VRGRKPTPTALKLLRNNPGRRPLNQAEPRHGAIDHAVPRQLVDPEAAAEWERVIETLSQGHVTTVDRAVLIAYCTHWARWQALETEASKHPFIVRSPNGYPIPNPALGMANKAFSLMLKAAVELGITPSSRSRIMLAEHEDTPRGRDEFSAFQRRRLGLH
jgi:P27 family predicted phage terminase small subunit